MTLNQNKIAAIAVVNVIKKLKEFNAFFWCQIGRNIAVEDGKTGIPIFRYKVPG